MPAGNAGDAAGALAQVERVELRLGETVAETVGDCDLAGVLRARSSRMPDGNCARKSPARWSGGRSRNSALRSSGQGSWRSESPAREGLPPASTRRRRKAVASSPLARNVAGVRCGTSVSRTGKREPAARSRFIPKRRCWRPRESIRRARKDRRRCGNGWRSSTHWRD